MLGAILDIGKSLAGNLFAEEQQEDAQVFNSAQAAEQRTFNAAEAQKQRDFELHNYMNRYRRTVHDLQQTGLNPMLALGHGPGAAGSGAAATGTAASSGIASPITGHSIAAGMQSASQVQLNNAAEERTRAEADRAKAEADEIRARTPTHAVNIQQTLQNIEESKNRVSKILAEIPLITQQQDTSAAHAAQMRQQVINLQAELPKIRAEINKLKTSAELDTQHYRESQARSDVADAQHDETRQRIKQNLPEIERLLRDLEYKHLGLTTHARGMDAAASANIIGAWRATIRAMTGQQPIYGR